MRCMPAVPTGGLFLAYLCCFSALFPPSVSVSDVYLGRSSRIGRDYIDPAIP